MQLKQIWPILIISHSSLIPSLVHADMNPSKSNPWHIQRLCAGLLCQRRSASVRQNYGIMVRPLPGQPVPCNILCVPHDSQHVRFRYQYVVHHESFFGSTLTTSPRHAGVAVPSS
jgi:hypothetical protein